MGVKGDLLPVMNHTKWEEIRQEMLAISPAPLWRAKDLNGYLSRWDGEWFYHFLGDGRYDTMEYVEVRTTSEEQYRSVGAALAKIHVPGEKIPEGFRVFGYVPRGRPVDYIDLT